MVGVVLCCEYNGQPGWFYRYTRVVGGHKGTTATQSPLAPLNVHNKKYFLSGCSVLQALDLHVGVGDGLDLGAL